MDATGFDRLTRTFTDGLSRRSLAGVLGLLATAVPGLADAKKKRKRKKKKITRNAFGCVNVGGFCKNSGQCCSGICQGKKGKKKCQAHDVGDCLAGEDACQSLGTECGAVGRCYQTTGQASFCGAGLSCVDCTSDADCEASKGPGAACVVCPLCALTDTACLFAAA